MITSCCICSVNIIGVCRRRYYSGPQDGQRDAGKRGKRAEIWSGRRRAKQKKRTREAAGVSEEKTEGEGGERRTERKLGSLSRIAVSRT